MPAMLLRRVAFPDFCEPCLPSPALKPPAGDGWLHEIKHDGFRLLVRRDAGGVRLFTRNGHDWTGRFSVREPEVHVRGRRPFPTKPRGSRYAPGVGDPSGSSEGLGNHCHKCRQSRNVPSCCGCLQTGTGAAKVSDRDRGAARTRSCRRGGKDQPAQRGQVRRVGHPVDDTVAVWAKDREISRNVVRMSPARLLRVTIWGEGGGPQSTLPRQAP